MLKKLKNGADVIVQRHNHVLARWRGEFVFWTVDNDGNAYWGHYFNDIEKAVEYFVNRTNLKGLDSYE